MKKFSQFFLNQNWRFFTQNNLVYFFNIATSKQLKVKFKSKTEKNALIFILNNLKNKNLKRDFLIKFPQLDKRWFTTTINKLVEFHIISQPKPKPHFFSNKYLLGLDRQIAFLDALFPKEGWAYKQKQLKDAKVACLGVGVIGQYVLLPLIASGVGNFICVDFDRVERRNIGRQPLFRKEDIGKLKVEVVKNFIKQNRSGIKVKAINKKLQNIQDVERVIRNSDIVVQSCDYPRFEIRRWINKACLNLKKPNIVAYSGRVGPLCIPYQTSCYGCLEMRMKEVAPFYEEFTEIIKNEGMRRYPEMGFVPALCGVITAREIVAFILGIKPETINAFLDIHPTTFQIIKHSLPRQKNCYACGKQKK